jgi:hypothetical protein
MTPREPATTAAPSATPPASASTAEATTPASAPPTTPTSHEVAGESAVSAGSEGEPPAEGEEWWAYAIGGAVVLAGVVVGIIVGATKEEEEPAQYVPSAGGLGEGTVSIGWPILSW